MIRPPAVKVIKVAGAFGCLFHLYFVIKTFVDSKKIMGGGGLFKTLLIICRDMYIKGYILKKKYIF